MAQYARPTSDISVGSNYWSGTYYGWSANGSSATDLYQQVDEEVLDTSDYARHYSQGSENAHTWKTGLGTISPPDDMTTVKVSVTSLRTATNYYVTIYLKYGSTTIKSWQMPADSVATTNVTTLSEEEAEEISLEADNAGHTDWEDLQLWFTGDDDYSGKMGNVYQAFLEAGDAGGGGGGGTVNSASDDFSLVDNFGNHFSLE